MKPKNLSNIDKTAILIMSLGEELAAELIRRLPQKDAQRILTSISRIGKIEDTVAAEIQNEFYDLVTKSKPTQIGDATATKRIIQLAFGGELSTKYLNAVAPDIPQSFKDAEHLDAKSLHQILFKERPQTIAIILAHLSPKKAGEVVTKFPIELRTEILLRMSTLQEVDQSILNEIDGTLAEAIDAQRRRAVTQIGGVDKTAALLATMNSTQREELLTKLSETQPDIADAIRAQLWTFEDLAKLQQTDIEKIIRRISPGDLEIALRKASDTLKAKIFTSMSANRAKDLKESLELAKPVAVAKVEDAQRRIAQLTAQMIQDSEINDPTAEAV